MSLARPVPAAVTKVLIAAVWAIIMAFPAAAATLSAHRAVYDMRLARSEPVSSVDDMTGRMVFEFLGDACTGYVANMRWVNNALDSDGTSAVSDMRSSTWEAGDGGAFGFSTTQYIGAEVAKTTRGNARRADGQGVAVDLEEPVAKAISFTGEVAFPTQHMLAVIAAARAGRRIFQKRVYDGSENGDKVYDTTTVIGAAAGPRDRSAAASGATQLEGLSAWPVSIAYFNLDGVGETLPVYQVSFDLYENGVSDSLLLDYGDIAIKGRMRAIEFLPATECG